jgi:glycogen synthase
MRITVYAPCFHPRIGGLEEVARLCSLEFHRQGHEVTVITDTLLDHHSELPFSVMRRSSWHRQLQAIKKSDVFLEFNISLKGLFLAWLCGKPSVVSHQAWFSDIRTPPPDLRARLKWRASKAVKNIACSQAVKDYLQTDAVVIPNPYDHHTFRIMLDMVRERDVMFAGRLVSDKGGNVLVEAMGLLKKQGLTPTFTITGAGPEEQPLKEQISALGLESQAVFTGVLRGEALAREMNRHRVLVVPSLWPEPFGIVALEGIACGCFVIGSEQGGLKDAIGPCGVTFPNGNSQALAAAIENGLLRNPPDGSISRHLSEHTSETVSQRYLETLHLALPPLSS